MIELEKMTKEKTTKESKRMKHDYTNEVELKSLSIREKNRILGLGSVSEEINNKLLEMCEEYKKDKNPVLKEAIIKLSETVQNSQKSRERFGEVVTLMIRKILTKPNFSGYSFRDDFYSDASFRVFKYIHNFDHTLKSKRTGQEVSCFSYITQIIHNSIIAIINERKLEAENNEHICKEYNRDAGIYLDSDNASTYEEEQKPQKYSRVDVDDVKLINKELIDSLISTIDPKDSKDYFYTFDIKYPINQLISIEHYDSIRDLSLTGTNYNISISRSSK